MYATTAILHQPILNFFPNLSCRFRSLKPFSIPTIPCSKLVITGGFVSKRPQRGAWCTNTMTEMIRTSAFSDGNGDEGVRVLEQEAFIDGSSNFVASNLQSTLNRLSKWLVAALFGAVVLWRHDAEAVWAAMGSVLNAGLSITLKRIVNQERPVSTLKSDPGMPSSHAQSIFFAVMFAIVSMVEWLGVNEVTLIVGGLVLAFGSYLSWLRVSEQFHTINQVLVGALVGSAFSILWFWSWKTFVLNAFVSYLWVRILIVLGGAGVCLVFLVYVIRYWLKDER